VWQILHFLAQHIAESVAGDVSDNLTSPKSGAWRELQLAHPCAREGPRQKSIGTWLD
jgi:hypothetical protein